jgi:hypothetical protein
MLSLTTVASGCMRHAQAKAAPAPPPLDVPLPPPRSIEPTEAEVPQTPVGLINEPTPAPPPRPRAAAPRPEVKPEPPKAEAPIEAARPPEEVKPPAAVLQTTPTQQEAEMEARIRALLDRAATTLNRVDYRNLGNNARTQYDTAKGFIKQADEALKAKNLLFANSLADKAAALAAQLGGR